MISLKYVGFISLTVMGIRAQDNILYKDFCYYNGSHLPQLHRTCPDKPTTELCYYNYPSNYTASVDDYMAMVVTVDYAKHPGKILICGGHVPAWVKETCFWFARHYFSCAARGAPKYNARIVRSEEYVDVGSLDLKTQVYDILPLRTEESGASDGRHYTTQSNLCWNEAELGANAVRVSYEGHWGSVGNTAIKDHPVLLRGDKVGQLLVKTLIDALEAMKDRTTYWQYNSCEINSLSARSQPVLCASDMIDCSEAVSRGCGFKSYETELLEQMSPMPHCPRSCDLLGPCATGTRAYNLPQTITVQLFDRDVLLFDYLTLQFEAKRGTPGCDIQEKYLMIVPFFIPSFPIQSFLGNTLWLNCAKEDTRADHPGIEL